MSSDWYRNAVIYQIHVRAFQDSNDDGIGDFDGLTSRLDYLQELGVTALWLLPFYPSPLRDDGYDIADYKGIHPDYGTSRSFRRFLKEAHRRDLSVITELVINHTSDEHAWFQRARRAAPGSRAREFYVWSDDPDRYGEARIIFSDYESSNWAYDKTVGRYYWHRFYSHQPDLNFDNPAVGDAILDVLDHWLGQGVDGLRLDAIPYLYEREGTNCENLPETHAFLKRLRAHVDEHHNDKMLLAEANQWPEDAVAYFGDGDECHMAFHFPVMPRLFMSVQMEDSFPITEILDQTPAIPDDCQWATFLRNHDELTLEMVTDEERDFMYRAYAQDRLMRINLGIRRRLAPLMGNDRRKIELLNALLFSLPGTPTIYYGDEIGMGDNVWLGDRDGVRTPMQWNADRNAGFSRSNPQSLYLPVVIDPEYHYEKVNVETQSGQSNSLLRWMRRLIAVRNRSPVFGRGSIEFLHPENSRVLAFVRALDDERVLVVANLSRFSQHAELDLERWAGLTPVEMFGAVPFPPVGKLPYLVTLGPYGVLWFALEHRRTEAPIVSPAPEEALPVVRLAKGERSPFRGRSRAALARALPAYLERKRWFGGKARAIQAAHVLDVVRIPGPPAGEQASILVVEIEFTQGPSSMYVVPLAIATGERAEQLASELAHGVVARLAPASGNAGAERVVYEALWSETIATALVEMFRRRGPIAGEAGELAAVPTRALRGLLARADPDARPHVLRGEQSNTSVVYGDDLVVKLIRRVDPGRNPEAELGEFLGRQRFEHVPEYGGSLEYRPRRGEPSTIAVIHEFVPNSGDAWQHTLDLLGRYLDEVVDRPAADAYQAMPQSTAVLEVAALDPPALAGDLLGHSVDFAYLLGRRTAELHAALAAPTVDPALRAERFSQLDRRSLYQSMRSLARVATSSCSAASAADSPSGRRSWPMPRWRANPISSIAMNVCGRSRSRRRGSALTATCTSGRSFTPGTT